MAKKETVSAQVENPVEETVVESTQVENPVEQPAATDPAPEETSAAEATAKDPNPNEATGIAKLEEEDVPEKVEIIVLRPFRDKNDPTRSTRYAVGTELEFDPERAADVVERGLAKYKREED